MFECNVDRCYIKTTTISKDFKVTGALPLLYCLSAFLPNNIPPETRETNVYRLIIPNKHSNFMLSKSHLE